MATGDEEDLLQQGLTALRQILEPHIEFVQYDVGIPQPATLAPPAADTTTDLLITLQDTHGGSSGPVLVEAREHVSPALITTQLRPQVEFMHRLRGDAAVLIISRWLSPRTRAALDDLEYGYLDLTGNVSFRLNRPFVRLRLHGVQRHPAPGISKGQRGLGGAKAGRLVRLLSDVRPPYQATDIARATDLSNPYVSRLLNVLRDQALLTIRGRIITDVEWAALLRARADSYALLKRNKATSFVARDSIAQVLQRLEKARSNESMSSVRLAVTGPIAVAAVVPIAVGGQLMIYIGDGGQSTADDNRHAQVQRSLGLLPVEHRGDVLLLSPADSSVFVGTRDVDGVPHVALSQLAVDSLGGSGRMPSEGETLLGYMKQRTDDWQLRTTSDWGLPPPETVTQ